MDWLMLAALAVFVIGWVGAAISHYLSQKLIDAQRKQITVLTERLQHAAQSRDELVSELFDARTELAVLRDLRARRLAAIRKYAAKRKGRG